MSSSFRPIVPGNTEGLEELVDQLLAGVPVHLGNGGNPGEATFRTNAQFWTLGSVAYRNGIYTVDLLKSLLDGGNARTQDEWATLYAQAKRANGFHAPDYPLVYGIVKTRYLARNDSARASLIDEMQVFLKKQFNEHWLTTLTGIVYKPAGNKDVVYHNHGTADLYKSDVEFVGKDDWIKKTSCTGVYQALLGTNDSINEINSVFHWLNGTNTHIWRLNSKPSQDDARVARLYADSGRVILGCFRNPTDSDPALGVRLCRAP